MPTARIVTVAEAIKDALNAASLSQAFTATRGYIPATPLEDLTTLTVTVVPRAERQINLTRGKTEYEYDIDVGIQQRVSGDDASDLDPLMYLAEQIADLFTRAAIAGTTPSAGAITITNEPRWYPDHLERYRVFTSVVTVTAKA